MNVASKKPNDTLRHQRQLRSWTLQEVADKLYELCKKDHPDRGINADIVGRWERGVAKPSAYYQAKLTTLFDMSPDQLGLIAQTTSEPTDENTLPAPSSQSSSIILLTKEQTELLQSLLTLESRTLTPEAKDEFMNKFRRNLLEQAIVGLLGAKIAASPFTHSVIEQRHIVNEDLVTLFETTLSTFWELYHTGGAIRIVDGLDSWVNQIANSAKEAQGTMLQGRVLILLTMSYQLQSCVFRDLMQYPQAHAAYQKAFHVAQELDNPEFMASALAREGVTYIQQEKPKQALIYLDGALTSIEGYNFPKLRGHVLKALSEAHALVQNAEDCWYNIGEAENIPDQSVEERSLTKFSKASLIAQKGVDAFLLHDYGQAIRLIDESFKTYDRTIVRGRARVIAQKAEAYYGLGAIDECVAEAKEALVLGRSAGSNKTIHRIQQLHTTLMQSPLRKEQSIDELTEMLITK